MIGWWLGQSIEQGMAESAECRLEIESLRNLALGVIGLVVVLVLITIVQQNANSP